MKTLEDAVRELDGVWPASDESRNHVEFDSWFYFVGLSSEMLYVAEKHEMAEIIICTRTEFEATAERMGYREPNATTQEAMKELEDLWHARGELPPVGTVCEAYYMHDANTRWRRVEILRHGNRECAVLCPDFDWLGWCNTFRPIRTDRERWVEAAHDDGLSLPDECDMRVVYGRVYDALLSGDLPTPGGDK